LRATTTDEAKSDVDDAAQDEDEVDDDDVAGGDVVDDVDGDVSADGNDELQVECPERPDLAAADD